MKVSTVLSYATFFLVIAFSTTLFAADAPTGKQDTRKAPTTATLNIIGKLPPVIKINAADVNLTTAMIDGAMDRAKTAAQNISLDNGEIAKMLPKLEQSISDYRNKVNECRNKSYTTEDQKNAHCIDSTTIAQCSQLLFQNCIGQARDKVILDTHSMDSTAIKTEKHAKELHKSIFDILNLE
jgi:hypothetical protein